MSLEILIPLALLAVERFLTARGFKQKVPQQLAGYLEALAQGHADKVPPYVQAALDAYVQAQVKRQIDSALGDLANASTRLDESFARAGAMAEAIKAGKPLGEVAKAGKKPPPPRGGRK